MNRRSVAGDYGLIVVGTFLIGFAIKSIYDPVSMVTGGVSGLAIIAKELWSVPLWLTKDVYKRQSEKCAILPPKSILPAPTR